MGYKQAAFVVASALAASLALLIPWMWPLGLIAPAVFLYILISPQRTPTILEAGYFGALFGFVFHLVIYIPAWDTYPLSFVGVESPGLSIAFIAFTWTIYSLVVSVAWGVFGAAVAFIRVRMREPLVLGLSVIVLWVVAEAGSALLFSLVSLGESVPLSFDFTAGALGYAFGAGPSVLLAPARIGGVWLLSACALVPSIVATTIFLARTEKVLLRSSFVPGVMLVCMVSIFVGLGVYDAKVKTGYAASWGSADELRVAAVATYIPAALKLSAADIATYRTGIEKNIEAVGKSGFSPNLIVFPEGARIREYSASYAALFSKWLPAGSVVFDSGYRKISTGQKLLEARGYRVGGEVEGRIGKQFPVAFGEYMPYFFSLAAKLFAPSLAKDLVAYRTYETDSEVSLIETGGVHVGTRLCSEVFSPRLYRDLAKKGAGLVMDISSVAMFHASPALMSQVHAAARVRAVETGLPMLAVFNGAEPFAFDCRGNAIEQAQRSSGIVFYRIKKSDTCPRF